MKSIARYLTFAWPAVVLCKLSLLANVPYESGSSSKLELPPVEWVLSQVITNAQREQENDRRFHLGYSYVRSKSQKEHNSKGKLVKNKESLREHVPAQPEAVTAVPLLATSDRSVQGDGSGGLNSEETFRVEDDGEIKGRAFDKRDFVLNADLLKRFDFSMVGVEPHMDRACWVMDFKPKSARLPVRNIKERFINKAAGRVWVDVQDGFVVKVDLYLTESVNVIGGLVGAVRACNYGFERERTPEGLWFTRAVNWNLEGRQVFSRKVIQYEEERRDIRRLF
jgi:hypothetical protein